MVLQEVDRRTLGARQLRKSIKSCSAVMLPDLMSSIYVLMFVVAVVRG